MSNRLMAEYPLEKLFECSLKELQSIKGIGPSKAMQVLAMFELGKRVREIKTIVKKITCAEDVFTFPIIPPLISPTSSSASSP